LGGGVGWDKKAPARRKGERRVVHREAWAKWHGGEGQKKAQRPHADDLEGGKAIAPNGCGKKRPGYTGKKKGNQRLKGRRGGGRSSVTNHRKGGELSSTKGPHGVAGRKRKKTWVKGGGKRKCLNREGSLGELKDSGVRVKNKEINRGKVLGKKGTWGLVKKVLGNRRGKKPKQKRS